LPLWLGGPSGNYCVFPDVRRHYFANLLMLDSVQNFASKLALPASAMIMSVAVRFYAGIMFSSANLAFHSAGVLVYQFHYFHFATSRYKKGMELRRLSKASRPLRVADSMPDLSLMVQTEKAINGGLPYFIFAASEYANFI
jgi:hypothetical protein